MSKNSDETVTKLHTDNTGVVWYARGIEAPKSSEKIVDTFTLMPMCSGKSAVFRVLGVPQNAELICTLFMRARQKEIRGLEIAGPNAIFDDYALLNTQQVVMRMSGIRVPVSCGGWHEATFADYNIYCLISRLARNGFVPDAPAQIYFGAHPIAKIMGFIPTLAPEAAAILAATIVDPRWFADRRSTDVTKKAFCFLGLTPAIQKHVSDSTRILTRLRELRCARVLAAWKSNTVSPDKIDLQNPANFLYRIWHAAGGGAKGDLRASQAFVQYVLANWLTAVERRPGTREGMFAPDHYFKTPAESAAYQKYAEAIAK
jgi:hypothetical protein